MSDEQHNCLHCGRAVVWSDEQKGWVDAYGRGECKKANKGHGALFPVDKYPGGRPRER